MRYFITFSYDGTAYHGWQLQPNAPSVQEELNRALSTLLRQEILTTGAGRTDAGVHAKTMVAHFDTDEDCRMPEDIVYKLNRLLPADISVSDLRPVKPDAHARFDALSRTYHYYIYTEKNPFRRHYAACYSYPLDFALMNEAAKMLLDVSDYEMTAYVDFGLLRNNLVNWNTGDVYSLFDGTWPVFGEQMVPLYDQISNERGRRSLIPVRLNGEYTYLVVEFPADGGEGRIIGANAGYDENGLPIRMTTRLQEGDRIVPVYTMYIDVGEDEDMEETEFEGDEIIWTEGMTVAYEDLSDEDETLEAVFCFVLNDVFGDYTMTDFIAFEL